ncbi:MAG: SUMF1/EgtB/PvdO family nonheme iron enzyme [Crocinitomicaceae bacterium]
MTSPCRAYKPNAFGLYNMAGNVSEFVQEKGILKGGSFNSTGYYLNIYHSEEYKEPDYRSAETGFRIVIQIIEY